MAVITDGPGPGRPAQLSQRLVALTRYGAAGLSLAVMAGVVVWGYGIVMRDVNGIPVVRAMDGPMRVAPDDPGGTVAPHIGLAVNAVVAVGEAAPPEDRLVLAPGDAGLAPEDLEAPVDTSTMEAAPAGVAAPAVPDRPMTADEVLALADMISAGVDPLSEAAPGVDAPVGLSVEGEAISDTARFTVIPREVPGVWRALRPVARPAGPATAAPATEAAAAAPPAREVDPATIAAGTALVQLGAYDTADLAAAEWGRLAERLPQFMGGKARVVQEASSGGRAFFRLRAMGFADLDDARRFCAALTAENVACIPVVVR